MPMSEWRKGSFCGPYPGHSAAPSTPFLFTTVMRIIAIFAEAIPGVSRYAHLTPFPCKKSMAPNPFDLRKAASIPIFPSFPGSTRESRENGQPARFSFHRLHLLSGPHLPSPYPAYIPRQRKAEKSQEPGEKENPLNADPVCERRCNQHREQSHGNEKGRG